MKQSKIISVRKTIPVSTLPSAPTRVTVESQMPILESVKVWCYSASSGVTPLESGWKLSSGGVQIIPAMGSVDGLTNEGFAPVLDSFVIEHEPGESLQGTPYKVDLDFYNIDSSVPVTFFVVMEFGPKIELPAAPVVSDSKEK